MQSYPLHPLRVSSVTVEGVDDFTAIKRMQWIRSQAIPDGDGGYHFTTGIWLQLVV